MLHHLPSDRLSEGVVLMKESLENLIRIVCKAIASLELPISKKALFEFEIAILIVERALKRIA